MFGFNKANATEGPCVITKVLSIFQFKSKFKAILTEVLREESTSHFLTLDYGVCIKYAFAVLL